MPDAIAQLADELAATKEEAKSKAALRVAVVTAVEATAEGRVQLDVAGAYWASTDTDSPLRVGDRVYAIQQGNVWVVSGRLDGTSATTPVGALTMYAGAAPPSGWLLCQGQSLLRTDYPALFAVLGTTYGSADASHFTLPNMQGRFPFGDDSTTALGATGGAKTVTLTEAQMPSHTHTAGSHTHSFSGSASHTHTVPDRATKVLAGAGGTTGASVADDIKSGTMTSSSTSVTISGTTGSSSGGASGSTGGDAAHENMPPWVALNFIIRAL